MKREKLLNERNAMISKQPSSADLASAIEHRARMLYASDMQQQKEIKREVLLERFSVP